MKAVLLMFDSLNRHMLECYGCNWTHTPNFKRLAERSATFDNSYIGSMPCMPARRDLHTGRLNFLHRAWGPLEPFDDSMPELLRKAGIHTHLATDHQHYWEDGGGTYHTRYSSFDLIRGQEGDPWVGQVEKPKLPLREIPREDGMFIQDIINRETTADPSHFPMNATFAKGIEYIRRNHKSDQWLLHLETFDPHEPFFSLPEFREPFATHFENYTGNPLEWPPYRGVQESPEAVEHARYEYAALLNGCDTRLGQILDLFDELNLWEDTMLIVCTDHGFLLGEHDSWAKCWLPFYNEVARTPFFLWDPRSPESASTRRNALVQPSIDIAPTLLNYFGLEPTNDMTGKDLAPVIQSDTAVREHATFGIFGGHVNITDGRYVYMRGPQSQNNSPLNEYTLMPTRMRRRFNPDELKVVRELAPPFPFTKGCPTLKIPISDLNTQGTNASAQFNTMLYDLKVDPTQRSPIQSQTVESKLTIALKTELTRHHAPLEQFERLGLKPSNQNS